VTVGSFVIGGLLVGVMIGIAVYGWVTLPADARVPVHRGIIGYGTFLPKTAGLVIWPVIGAAMLAVLIAVTESAIKPHHDGPGTARLIILVVLAIAAAAEWGAIAAARKGSRTLGG